MMNESQIKGTYKNESGIMNDTLPSPQEIRILAQTVDDIPFDFLIKGENLDNCNDFNSIVEISEDCVNQGVLHKGTNHNAHICNAEIDANSKLCFPNYFDYDYPRHDLSFQTNVEETNLNSDYYNSFSSFTDNGKTTTDDFNTSNSFQSECSGPFITKNYGVESIEKAYEPKRYKKRNRRCQDPNFHSSKEVETRTNKQKYVKVSNYAPTMENAKLMDTLLPPIKILEKYNEIKKPWIKLLVANMEIEQLNALADRKQHEYLELLDDHNIMREAYSNITQKLHILQNQYAILLEIFTKSNNEIDADALKEFIEMKSICLVLVSIFKDDLGNDYINIANSIYKCTCVSDTRPWFNILMGYNSQRESKTREDIVMALLQLNKGEDDKE